MKYTSNDIQIIWNTPCSFGWAGGAKVVDHPVYKIDTIGYSMLISINLIVGYCAMMCNCFLILYV